MPEMTHAELQRHHYAAVRDNPQYRQAGMMDVEREWLEMNVPPEADWSELHDRLNDLEAMAAEPGRIPRRYYEQFQQIRGEIAFLRNKIEERRTKPAPVRHTKYKGLVHEG